ncbi:substrate-binding periplasmic protein [Thalassospira australica]|uniref:substrate-binding periplasmic protein n=1 Tax=Thalassospira australica TaxID=1528106 RepID=UPI0038505BF3
MQLVTRARCAATVCVAAILATGIAHADEAAGYQIPGTGGDRDCTRLLASGNPDYPPYLWPANDGSNHLIGAAADFLMRVGEVAGVEIEVVNTGSWGRVQQNMREGSIDLIAGAFFTLPRLEYMDYFYPAFLGTRTVIWTKDNIDIDYGRWEDLRGLEGLTVINNSFGQEFDSYAAENLTIREVPSLEQGLRMLERDRAEYLIYEEFPGKAFAARENIKDIQSYDTPVSEEDLYLTMSHRSPCNTGEMRGRIAQALFTLVTGKVVDEMMNANIARWGAGTN